VKDPVCEMMVDPHTTAHRAQHHGKPYYFCSSRCQSKFVADPAKYVGPTATRKAEAVPEGTIYTCPMHPEIRQVGPGSCPICGMALEPVLVSAEAAPNAELIDMKRRFWIGLALTLPVFALEMGTHLTGLDRLIPRSTPTGFKWPLRPRLGYDEPETLPSSTHPICLMSADGGRAVAR
jgi:Cu+-exporting ATPase